MEKNIFDLVNENAERVQYQMEQESMQEEYIDTKEDKFICIAFATVALFFIFGWLFV